MSHFNFRPWLASLNAQMRLGENKITLSTTSMLFYSDEALVARKNTETILRDLFRKYFELKKE